MIEELQGDLCVNNSYSGSKASGIKFPSASWRFPEKYACVPFLKYNEMIHKLCQDENVELADQEKKNIRYETLDGSHPTALGHNQIAEAWIECCKELDKVRYDVIPEYNLRYLKAIRQLKKGKEDYRIEVAVQPDVKITLKMKGWQTSNDAMKMLGEMNLVGEYHRFTDWPKANLATGPDIHHRSALVCELDNKMTYHIEFYNPKRMVCLYGCPNARALRNCKLKKSVEIIKYE